ncbi:MAG TPA: YncE family protein [Nitrospira sp.]|nr:YncE family protein [Nitrospira sp.]MCW5796679.1 YncE family protein [Nitrospira sp.]HMV56696.1 YncE family protein [Nitrospira sp.]HMX92128.1 YncE family protein [Nitrospira sp.]HNC82192.1 YncE family protein [Nitrospira sp.]
MKLYRSFILTLGLLLACNTLASAEILALLNYESKPDQTVRREGIAIMDIDPESGNFGKILMEIPLPPDLVAHHIFFNRDRSKAYVTALGKSILHVVNLTEFPYRLRAIDVPDCQMGEDLAVSEDNRTWYLTCMGSNNVIMGDALLDKPIKTVSAAEPALATIQYPHGIAIHNGIDRVLVTSTVKPDMSDAGDSITVMEAGSGRVLSTHKVSAKPSPAKAAPVEVMFSPNSNPPAVHITNMLEGTLWAGLWDPASKTFSFHQVDDFGPRQQGMPLEMLYNAKGDRLFVTTAKPGFVNLYDNSDPGQPKFLKTIAAAAGAHHSVLSPDERYLFVQNSFLNLDGMSDGSITVIDLKADTILGNIDTLKAQGFNPNCIMLLPAQPGDLRASRVTE